jgi:hypothetical protein
MKKKKRKYKQRQKEDLTEDPRLTHKALTSTQTRKTTRKRRIRGGIRKGDEYFPPNIKVGTLTRTKKLLLAALRVWELKNGIS